jgi:hypothetical protein
VGRSFSSAADGGVCARSDEKGTVRAAYGGQTGIDEPTRQNFLHSAWDEADNLLIHSWEPRSTEVPPDVL